MSKPRKHPSLNTTSVTVSMVLLSMAMTGCKPKKTSVKLDQDDCSSCLPFIPAAPPIASLEVVPRDLVARPGDSFELRAYLKDDSDGIISEAYTSIHVAWKWLSSGETGLVETTRHRALLTLSPAVSGVLEIVALSGGHQSPAVRITIEPTALIAAQAAQDRIIADHQTGAPPVIARFFDLPGPNPSVLHAFVAEKTLGDSGGQKEVAVFSSASAFKAAEHMFQSGQADKLDMSVGVTEPRKLAFNVVAASGYSSNKVDAMAELGAKIASAIYGDSRAGISFVANPAVETETTDLLGSLDDSCRQSNFPNADPATITVVYVRRLAGKGYSCRPSIVPGKAGVIYLDWGDRTPTTLSHELGHLLSLRTDRPNTQDEDEYGKAGHTNGMTGFDAGNLMWTGESDKRRGSRGRLTLGQIYRINRDARSWLHLKAGTGVECNHPTTTAGQGANYPCPELALDTGGGP